MRNTVDDAQLICETFNRNTRILLLKSQRLANADQSPCATDQIGSASQNFLGFFTSKTIFLTKCPHAGSHWIKIGDTLKKWPAKERFWELCQSQVHIGNVFLKKETAHNTNVLFEWKEKFFSLIITGVKTLSKKLLTQFF